MKRYLLLVLMAVIAMFANATDRFYMESFMILPGETCTVSIMLDNEVQYTAFQTDLYLPEGLTVEQEDGDYIFDLTTRKGRDHNIASQVQPNGSIRVMSYSPSIKAYSGNSGALVTFNVIASDDFGGTAYIELQNTLFTTVAGVEVAFEDEVCEVTSSALVLTGDANGDNVVDVGDVTLLINSVLGNYGGLIYEGNADMNGDTFLDVSDVTLLIQYILDS